MLEKIKTILREICLEQGIDKIIDNDTHIINDLGLDSIMTVNFLLKIEEEFNIMIDYDNFDTDVLSSIVKFHDFIREQKPATAVRE